MKDKTRKLWSEQHRRDEDRERLFRTVAETFEIHNVLYPGSYVDIAPSFVFSDVTYVDSDRRAAAFFDDTAGVDELISQHRELGSSWRFVHGDYNEQLPIGDGTCDLVVSLYGGFISAPCRRYLRNGGLLLVAPSHGDVAMASLDDRYELVGVVNHGSSRYTIGRDNLDTYLIPKKDSPITIESVAASGRGVAYTRSAFAYIFENLTEPPAKY